MLIIAPAKLWADISIALGVECKALSLMPMRTKKRVSSCCTALSLLFEVIGCQYSDENKGIFISYVLDIAMSRSADTGAILNMMSYPHRLINSVNFSTVNLGYRVLGIRGGVPLSVSCELHRKQYTSGHKLDSELADKYAAICAVARSMGIEVRDTLSTIIASGDLPDIIRTLVHDGYFGRTLYEIKRELSRSLTLCYDRALFVNIKHGIPIDIHLSTILKVIGD